MELACDDEPKVGLNKPIDGTSVFTISDGSRPVCSGPSLIPTSAALTCHSVLIGLELRLGDDELAMIDDESIFDSRSNSSSLSSSSEDGWCTGERMREKRVRLMLDEDWSPRLSDGRRRALL